MSLPLRVSLVSLGCAKNLADSEALLARVALSSEMELCAEPRDADLVLLNTCGFLQASRQESLAEARALVALKGRSRVRWVVVSGCAVERYPEEFRREVPGVDAFLDFNRYPQVAELVASLRRGDDAPPPCPAGGEAPRALYGERLLLTPRHFAYLRLSEGCDFDCTFCAIPRIRGGHRSRPMEEIVEEAVRLAGGGVREVSLIGQDTTFYGRDLYREFRLPALLRELARVDALRWIRLHYANPAYLTPHVIEALAALGERGGYLDMPIQHISDPILKAMGRAPGKRGTMDLVARLRAAIPGLALRTTVMTGFPGEGEAEFSELLDWVREARFDHLGCFAWSPEEGTPAFDLPGRVPAAIGAARRDRIMEAQQEIAFARQKGRVGATVEVIVDEEPEDGREGVGRTRGDAPDVDAQVLLRGRGFRAGALQEARVIGTRDYDLVAEVARSPRGAGRSLLRPVR
jgi:ribosomal protein S12 methylthiotransferase